MSTNREAIIQDLVTSLEAIREGQDIGNHTCNYSVTRVIRPSDYSELYLDTTYDFIVMVVDGEETPIATGVSYTFESELEMFLYCFKRWEPDTEDPFHMKSETRSEVRNKVIDDVKAALTLDDTRSDLAEDTDFAAILVDIGELKPWAYALFRLVIPYEWQASETGT